MVFVDLTTNESSQGSHATLGLLIPVLYALGIALPSVTGYYLRADNAACFSSSEFIIGLAILNALFPNFSLRALLFNESGDGKTGLDVHFSFITKRLIAWVNAGHNLLNPRDYLMMMAWRSSGISPLHSSFPMCVDFPAYLRRLQAIAIPHVSRIFHVIFTGRSSLRWQAASGIGEGVDFCWNPTDEDSGDDGPHATKRMTTDEVEEEEEQLTESFLSSSSSSSSVSSSSLASFVSHSSNSPAESCFLGQINPISLTVRCVSGSMDFFESYFPEGRSLKHKLAQVNFSFSPFPVCFIQIPCFCRKNHSREERNMNSKRNKPYKN